MKMVITVYLINVTAQLIIKFVHSSIWSKFKPFGSETSYLLRLTMVVGASAQGIARRVIRL